MEHRENRDVRKPFLATPDSRVYFPAATIERARRTTERCLTRGEGVALVVGTTGVGKTLLARTIASDFESDNLTVVVSPSRNVAVKAFWQQILFGLRQTFCGCDETELRLMTLDYLERSQARRLTLLIDDAQNLPARVFDELRGIVDQGPAVAAQIDVALFGSNALEERLNLPRLYSFQQRIAARSYLEPFDKNEINDYIDREARRFGERVRFLEDAKSAVGELSGGVPRIVNQLGDRSLVLTAESAGVDFDSEDWANFTDVLEVGREFVERAWANLQNFDETQNDGGTDEIGETAESLTGAASNVVEFGTLDEEDEESGEESNEFAGADDEPSGASFAAVSKAIDWEAERYGNAEPISASSGGPEHTDNNDRAENADFADAEAREVADDREDWEENADEEESADDGDSGEIDAALEARLLQKLNLAERGAANDAVEDADSNETSENIENAEINDSADSVESNDVRRRAKTESTTRRIATPSDDGTRAFREANGFDVEALNVADEALEVNEKTDFNDKTDAERCWETSFSRDSVVGRSVSAAESVVASPETNASNGDELRSFASKPKGVDDFESLEDRAYRGIAEDCYRASREYRDSERYLSELQLLENEIAEEANLIRRIRNIHLRLRSVQEERFAVAASPSNEAEAPSNV